MLRLLAKWWAKRRYVWKEEFEAAIAELNAKAALSQAKDKQDLIAQVTKEADTIEARIADLVKKEEQGFWLCDDGHEVEQPPRHEPNQNSPMPGDAEKGEMGVDYCKCGKPMKFIKRDQMSGQEQYESDQERKEAEKILQSKHDYAEKQLPQEIKGHTDTANHFNRQAAQARTFADRLRRL